MNSQNNPLTTQVVADQFKSCIVTHPYDWWNQNCYPQSNWITVTNTGTSVSDMDIRKVENGFIVKQGYKEFVFEEIKSLNKFILDFYNKGDK